MSDEPTTEPTTSTVVYEQPLSERIRAFLRLEFLFERAHYQLQSVDVWASRGALESINDVMAIVSRTDVKKELISELERHGATLGGLHGNRNVDQSRLELVMDGVSGLLSTLKGVDSAPGLALREHELLSAVRQRSSIPAGTCDFDLPGYHYWLRTPSERRLEDLNGWLQSFDSLREATSMCLQLVRESAIASQETANAGFFQRTLEANMPCQLIRVAIPEGSPYFPEISAGKHRFTVRFMSPENPAIRPVQVTDDIPFRLLRCVI